NSYRSNDNRFISSDATEFDNNVEDGYNIESNITPIKNYKNGQRATSADFVDDSQHEGSLWASNGQTNYYFTKNKVRGVGDLISISINDDMIRDIAAEIKRTLSQKERELEIVIAKEGRIKAIQEARNKTISDEKSDNNPEKTRAVATEKISDPINTTAIDITQSLEIKPGETIIAEILERYPNGNYKVRGRKKIIYKNGRHRMITLLAVAKSAEIGDDDAISSNKLYEYRLEAMR
ncbi:MAG: flagellar basal body L-ring protein FlgH, partial [Candidatus Poribacteria bacterium]